MNEGLKELKRMAYENACCRCQYYIDKKCTNKGECVWKTIEKELKEYETFKTGLILGNMSVVDNKILKEYQEFKDIAKRYNWDDITSEIFNVKADKKYRDLFSSAIIHIQEDYRKARALEIIKELPDKYKEGLIYILLNALNEREISQEQFDLSKEVLL